MNDRQILELTEWIAESGLAGFSETELIDGFCRRAVSFAPLKKLRADYVKVDGCVTRKLLVSEAADTKLKAVLSVAEMLDIGVVAECVEEADVLARLRELKVGYAQGFGVEHPQPITQFALTP